MALFNLNASEFIVPECYISTQNAAKTVCSMPDLPRELSTLIQPLAGLKGDRIAAGEEK